MNNKRLYNIWACMKQRCNNPKHTAARWYHDRGIRVCQEWNDSFDAFESWSTQNGYADDLTIDRINPDGNYDPNNCRWVTLKENVHRARKPNAVTSRKPNTVTPRKHTQVAEATDVTETNDCPVKHYWGVYVYRYWFERIWVRSNNGTSTEDYLAYTNTTPYFTAYTKKECREVEKLLSRDKQFNFNADFRKRSASTICRINDVEKSRWSSTNDCATGRG